MSSAGAAGSFCAGAACSAPLAGGAPSRIAKRSLRPSMTMMAFGFSVASWSLITAGQSSVSFFGVVADEARGGADLAHHAGVRLIGVGFIEPVAEPIGHQIADHHDGRGRRRLQFARRRRLGIIGNRRPVAARPPKNGNEKKSRCCGVLVVARRWKADRSNNRPGRPLARLPPLRLPQSRARSMNRRQFVSP